MTAVTMPKYHAILEHSETPILLTHKPLSIETSEVVLLDASTYTRLLAIEAAHERLKDAARTLISGTGGKSRTTEYGECYVPQDADFERLAGVVE